MGASSKRRPRTAPTTILTHTLEYRTGFDEGERIGKKKALDFLEEKYMDPDLDVSGPRGKAILEVAKELAKHLREA